LETVVHLNAGGLPLDRYAVGVTIPDAVWGAARTEGAGRLPVGWDADPLGRAGIQLGSAWIRSGASALLRVPSVIVPDEYNVLINLLHPDSRAISASKIWKFLYDPGRRPVMGNSRRRAPQNDRTRLGERGIARFEVLGREADLDLIRARARRLAEEGSKEKMILEHS
jgi:RES domain